MNNIETNSNTNLNDAILDFFGRDLNTVKHMEAALSVRSLMEAFDLTKKGLVTAHRLAYDAVSYGVSGEELPALRLDAPGNLRKGSDYGQDYLTQELKRVYERGVKLAKIVKLAA